MANNELLDKTITLVEAEAATNGTRWHQGTWGYVYTDAEVKEQGLSCNTAGCFAGWAVQLAGGTFHLSDVARETLERFGEVGVDNCTLPGDDTVVPIADAAIELLGINDDQADILFNGNNDKHDLRRIVEALKADPDADLYDVYD